MVKWFEIPETRPEIPELEEAEAEELGGSKTCSGPCSAAGVPKAGETGIEKAVLRKEAEEEKFPAKYPQRKRAAKELAKNGR